MLPVFASTTSLAFAAAAVAATASSVNPSVQHHEYSSFSPYLPPPVLPARAVLTRVSVDQGPLGAPAHAFSSYRGNHNVFLPRLSHQTSLRRNQLEHKEEHHFDNSIDDDDESIPTTILAEPFVVESDSSLTESDNDSDDDDGLFGSSELDDNATIASSSPPTDPSFFSKIFAPISHHIDDITSSRVLPVSSDATASDDDDDRSPTPKAPGTPLPNTDDTDKNENHDEYDIDDYFSPVPQRKAFSPNSLLPPIAEEDENIVHHNEITTSDDEDEDEDEEAGIHNKLNRVSFNNYRPMRTSRNLEDSQVTVTTLDVSDDEDDDEDDDENFNSVEYVEDSDAIELDDEDLLLLELTVGPDAAHRVKQKKRFRRRKPFPVGMDSSADSLETLRLESTKSKKVITAEIPKNTIQELFSKPDLHFGIDPVMGRFVLDDDYTPSTAHGVAIQVAVKCRRSLLLLNQRARGLPLRADWTCMLLREGPLSASLLKASVLRRYRKSADYGILPDDSTTIFQSSYFHEQVAAATCGAYLDKELHIPDELLKTVPVDEMCHAVAAIRIRHLNPRLLSRIGDGVKLREYLLSAEGHLEVNNAYALSIGSW